jgi:ATP-dependent helicase/nuclease subunit A
VSDGTRPVADAAARERALDVTRSFIVQAPAGSGKTDLLVKRYLALLDIVQKPEEVLAITFTRKAAAEMRARVYEGLRERRGADAALLANRLRIQTIDALCASLTRQMPVLSRFGAQPGIVEDARELHREAALRTLALLEDPAHPASAQVARLLAHLDGNAGTLVGLISGMLGKRDQWMRRTGEAPSREELEAALAAERERILEQACAIYPEACEALALDVLTKKGAWRKRPKPAPANLVAIEGLQEALAALLSLPPPRYTDAQWQVLGAIVALLPLAAAQLKLVFAERGEVDFAEIAQGAVRSLGTPDDPTDLLLSLDVRIGHILVDEFQDTSGSQWELLERLTAGWEPGDGRTLYAVGDPMQSIYRFREAEVALFLRARREGLPNVRLEPLVLTTNFRSQAGIVEWINSAFAQILPRIEDEVSGAVPYAPSQAYHPPLEGKAVRWHAFAGRGDEARRVVEIVRDARARAPGGTCAILVRNRSALSGIVPALKEAGLRFRAIEIEHLGERPVVQDLLALTRALSHPADRIAWLAVLRAPWCGLELADLAALAETQDRPDVTVLELMHDEGRLAALTPAGRERLLRTREVLQAALADRLRGSVRERVEGAWFALGGPACVQGRTDLEDAAIFLARLESEEEAGALADLAAFETSLDELYALPDVDADESLQIMTIHKAKGLQFDTVILPGLDRAPGRGDPPLFLWKARGGGRLLLAPIKETGGKKEPAYDYVNSLERTAEDTESGRLLYVAATRAQQYLHLLGCVRLDDSGVPRRPSKGSLLRKAWAVAEPAFAQVELPALADAALALERAPYELRRLAGGVKLAPPPEAAKWNARDDEAPLAEIEFSWAGETARHVGTVVHRWLQRMAEDLLQGWTSQRVGELRPQIARDLHRRGVPAAESEAAAARAITAMANILDDERGRWLLGPREGAVSELRIRTSTEGRLRTLVVDRTFVENGTRWVVDYKTSSHEGAGVEAFLERERERYAPQLARYAKALGKARLGLYFPMLRGWKEWE